MHAAAWLPGGIAGWHTEGRPVGSVSHVVLRDAYRESAVGRLTLSGFLPNFKDPLSLLALDDSQRELIDIATRDREATTTAAEIFHAYRSWELVELGQDPLAYDAHPGRHGLPRSEEDRFEAYLSELEEQHWAEEAERLGIERADPVGSKTPAFERPPGE